MFLVCLTGGIGTGKSTVGKMLEEHNIPLVDADVFARKGSQELTSAFISLRNSHDDLFTKRRNSACHGYSVILRKLVELKLVDENALTPRQLRKKWENLLKRYRKLKLVASSGVSSYSSSTELTYESWPFYKDMDQIIIKQEPLTHMLLSEPLPSQQFDYSDEYCVNPKRFRSNSEDYSPEASPVVEEDKGRQLLARPEVLHRLLALHERFVSLYERLVVTLERAGD